MIPAERETVFSTPSPRTRRLKQALIVSLLANVAFSLLSYVEWNEVGYLMLEKFQFAPKKEAAVSAEAPFIAMPASLEEAITAFNDKSANEMIELLYDDTIVLDGYRRRDLALSLLTSLHHFHLAKALPGLTAVKEERRVTMNGLQLTLYPQLTNEQFVLITRFAANERYPFTAEGLFAKLKEVPFDEGLKAAFAASREFVLLETLFKNEVSQNDLLQLVSSCDWATFSSFVEGQQKTFDRSTEKKRAFLLQAVNHSAKPAACILYTLDRNFVVHTLDDTQCLIVLTLLDTKPELSKEYALALLESERSSKVWKLAAATLSQHLVQKTT
ncbi:MAG TPA: hypothetical protein VN457_07110, partial [Chlamydiales bacterium]|nr:hypothetical protein [Chlamydiales bacterium]